MNVQFPEPLAVVIPREFAPSNISIDAFGCDVPIIVGVLSLVVELFEGEVITGAETVVLIVNVTAVDEALVLFAESVAVAVNV